MNPAYISLASLLLLVPLAYLGQIMPLFNLHVASDREALLRSSVEAQLSTSLKASKTDPALISDLVNLKIPGLTPIAARLNSDGEYVVAELDYQFTGLIASKYFDTSKLKTIKVAGVRTD
jgi:hypothetical protein